LPPDGVLACWQSSTQKTAPAVAKQTAALSEAKIHRVMSETVVLIIAFRHQSTLTIWEYDNAECLIEIGHAL
jgi:hypothetical protein